MEGDALRVTKEKGHFLILLELLSLPTLGKRLKLEIRSRVALSSANVDVFLTDETAGMSQLSHSVGDGFTVLGNRVTTSGGIAIISVDLKLERGAKEMQFRALIQTAQGEERVGSISFSAHDSGKQGTSLLPPECTCICFSFFTYTQAECGSGPRPKPRSSLHA